MACPQMTRENLYTLIILRCKIRQFILRWKLANQENIMFVTIYFSVKSICIPNPKFRRVREELNGELKSLFKSSKQYLLEFFQLLRSGFERDLLLRTIWFIKNFIWATARLIVTKKGMPETSFNTTEAQTYGKQSRFISDSIDHDSTVSPPHNVSRNSIGSAI